MNKIELTEYQVIYEWNTMEIESSSTRLGISSYPDGEVEIECTLGFNHESGSIILNQDELKKVIAFLQTKVK